MLHKSVMAFIIEWLHCTFRRIDQCFDIMCFTSLFTGNCKNWLFFHLFGCSAARSSDYLEWIWMDGRELTNILFSFKVLQKAILLFKANGCNMWLSSSVYFVQNIKISILTDHLSKLGLLSKHLKGQSGPTVSDKKVCVCNVFAYYRPFPIQSC